MSGVIEERVMSLTLLATGIERAPRRARSALLGTLWLVLAIVLALAWLAFPYLLNGRRVLGDVGYSVQAERMSRSSATARLLIRTASGPGEADVDALYATTEYLDLIDPSGAARKYQPGRYLVFLVTETTHVEQLPGPPPRATLSVDGRRLEPADINGPAGVQHHRTSVIRFPLLDAAGHSVLAPSAKRLDLELESAWDRGRASVRKASWDLPIVYPQGTSNQGMWNLALVMSLSAGLLSAVLTPCLLQLVVVYLAAMAGIGAGVGNREPERKRVLVFAAAFVAGFTALYTTAGAVVGHLGHESQVLFATINRPAGIASGTLIIALALWTARQSSVPVVCRLPMPAAIERVDRSGALRAALTAAAFSVGCITCFGGAIVGTLLVYVGSVGSAGIGAAIMLTFSAGIAIPFLAAAFALSRAGQFAEGLARARPWAGFAASVIMAAFGLVLISDNFHTLSDVIYPLLHLPAQR
jgi:cytochrome c-type biogenesis protein